MRLRDELKPSRTALEALPACGGGRVEANDPIKQDMDACVELRA